LKLNLEEVLRGCKKTFSVRRKVLDENGKERIEDKTFEVDVPAGIATGEQIVYTRQGNQSEKYALPGDVIFTAVDAPHKTFKRTESDIVFTAFITKSEADNGVELMIPTLEEDECELKLPKITNPKNAKKTFEKKGLPKPNNFHVRGDLIVKFDLIDENKKGSFCELLANIACL